MNRSTLPKLMYAEEVVRDSDTDEIINAAWELAEKHIYYSKSVTTPGRFANFYTVNEQTLHNDVEVLVPKGDNWLRVYRFSNALKQIRNANK